MALNLGLQLTNAVLGLSTFIAGEVLSEEAKEEMAKLQEKQDALVKDIKEADELHDHTYYLVAVNGKRVKKAIDKLPNDIIEKVQGLLATDPQAQQALAVLGKIAGYGGATTVVGLGVLEIVKYWRQRKAEEPTRPPPEEENPFEGCMGDEEIHFQPSPEEPASLPKSSRLDKAMLGLNIAGVAFGAVAFGLALYQGISTLDKIEKAMAAIEKKQTQLTNFKEGMVKALDSMVKAAGFKEKNYEELRGTAKKWEEISENFDSYQKALYYAIKGYYNNKSQHEIKIKVDQISDPNKPFPKDAYLLAKTIADDITTLHVEKKMSDKDVVKFFATDNPKLGLRFVLDEFFIKTLFDPW